MLVPMLANGRTLPAGPPVLVVTLAVVGVVLAWRASNPLTDRAVLATSPWVLAAATVAVSTRRVGGAGLSTQLGAPPVVYLVTLTGATATWAVLGRLSNVSPRTRSVWLTGIGGVVGVSLVAVLLVPLPDVRPVVPALTLLLATGLAGVVWWRFGRYFSTLQADTGTAGAFVVFAHVLDGVTTAVGIDRLGLSEQTPLARTVLRSADGLPVAPVVGVGWVFILLKIVVALAFVWYVPTQLARSDHDARFLFALVATFGLGPGVQNLFFLLVA